MAENKTVLKLRWSSFAKNSLMDIADYIKRESPQNAQKVVQKIRETARKITQQPDAYPIMHEISTEDMIYRYALCYKYKIIFRVKVWYILIIDIFHSSRNPENLQKSKESDKD